MVIWRPPWVPPFFAAAAYGLARSPVRDYDEWSGRRPCDDTNDLLFATFDDDNSNETKDEIRTGEASDLGARPVGDSGHAYLVRRRSATRR
jgi:hypothetical protein